LINVKKRFSKLLYSDLVDRSLRTKITLGVALPLLVILATFTFVENSHHRSELLDNLSILASYNGQLIEDTLVHSMLESDFEDVQRILDTVGGNENFRVVYLLNTSGRVMFAPNGSGIGTQLDNSNPSCTPCHDLPVNERPSSVIVNAEDGQRVFRSMHPIENSPACSQCHDAQQRLLGLLLTDISAAPFDTALAANFRANLFMSLTTILVSIIIVNLGMRLLVIHRLEKVASALAGFGSGKRNLRLEPESSDEIGQLEVAFNEMGKRIQAEEAQNQALSENLRRQTTQRQKLLKRLITAQEDERKRVARELHDELGQSLTGLSLHSEAMRQFISSDPDRALEQLSITRDLIGKTTQQMYELILALRPAVLDDLGLATALNSLADTVLLGNGIKFELDASGLMIRLPPSIETSLYRIFQEALSNIVRHSSADFVKITLAQHDSVFEGEIVDNGRGFDPENLGQDGNNPRGLGLLGMRERIAQCDGRVDIISKIGEGTRIRVRVPLVESDCD
jgi:signal transduction histidine kinase